MDLAFQMRHLMTGEHFNGLRTMKKIYMIVAALSVVFAAVSCNKEDVTVGSSEPIVVRFTAQAADVKAQFNPTSYENGAAVPVLWNGGEKLSIALGDNNAKDFARDCAEVVASEDKKSAAWEYDFSGLATEEYTPAAPYTFHVFCGAARAYRTDNQSKVLLNNIPSEQTPGVNSCDPKAIYLYSKSGEYETWPSEVVMDSFEHLTAYGCITLGTGIPEEEKVQSVTITADAATNLSGATWYFYKTGNKYANYTGSTSPKPAPYITLKPAKDNDALQRENIWFGCRPTTALTSLTFEVVTEAGETYKVVKDLTGKNLNFTAGKVAKMTINGFEKVEEEADDQETITYTWTAADSKIGFITGTVNTAEGLDWNDKVVSQTFTAGTPALQWVVNATATGNYNIACTSVSASITAKRLKLGSGSDVFNPVTFTIAPIEGYKVKAISVYTSVNKETSNYMLSASVGETSFLNDEKMVASKNPAAFTAEVDEAVEGPVEITISGETADVFYLYKMEIVLVK